jgi:hypothetical protein
MNERKCQHKRALELFQKIGDTVTPDQIDKHVGGTGSYYSKHMSVMRRWGFEFSVKKDGREIVSYTLTKMPANASEYRAGKASKAKKVVAKKAAPVAKSKVVKPAAAPKVVAAPAPKAKTKNAKATNLRKIKEIAEKRNAEKETLKATPSPTSFTVDPDWDAVEEVDIAALV